MNKTKDPLELKLSALQIGWTDDASGKHTYFSNEVPGKIQIWEDFKTKRGGRWVNAE